MLGALRPGDVLIADGYYCTYWLLAMCKARGVEVVMKNHHKREDQPVDARPICKGQRKVVWPRPQCPDWMSKQEYATIPRSIEIRLVDVQVNEPGFRTDQFTVATTILDHRVFTTECSPPSVHHRVFTTECSPPSVHLRVFTSECSPPSVHLRVDRFGLSQSLVGGVGYPHDKMFARNGGLASESTGDGSCRIVVMHVGL